MTKYAKHMSAEMILPDWIPDDIREFVIFEYQRAGFHHPFNRYAWVLLRGLDPNSFRYNSPHTRKIGRALSLTARVVLAAEEATDQVIWEEAATHIVNMCLARVESKTEDQLCRTSAVSCGANGRWRATCIGADRPAVN